MRSLHTPHHRRGFLRLGLTVVGGSLLSGCGGGSEPEADAVLVVTAPATPSIGPAAAGATSAINLALTLGYVGAQYYGVAARGTGLAGAATSGVGQTGTASGGRMVAFADPIVAGHAAELADDKAAHVAALRTQLAGAAAAQPAIDLSPAGAFSRAARQAGLVATGVTFDPYADDASFLTGAFLLENAVAAAYRTLLAQTADATAAALIGAQLGDAIYHGGLIRSLLDERAATDPTLDRAMLTAAQAMLTLDGTAGGDLSAAAAGGIAANLADAEGRPIPFTRDAAQVLRTLTLSTGGIGGFLPAGANGLPA